MTCSWGRGGNWGDEISVIGEDGKDLCPNFLQPREFLPIFHNPHRKAVTGNLVKIKKTGKMEHAYSKDKMHSIILKLFRFH